MLRYCVLKHNRYMLLNSTERHGWFRSVSSRPSPTDLHHILSAKDWYFQVWKMTALTRIRKSIHKRIFTMQSQCLEDTVDSSTNPQGIHKIPYLLFIYNYIHIHMHIYIYILRYKDWNGIPFSIRLNHSQSAGGNGELHGLVLYIALISIAHNATENHCSLCLSPINFCSHVFPILAAENFTKSKAFWSLTRLHCPEHRNYDPEMSKLFVKYFEDTPKNVRS